MESTGEEHEIEFEFLEEDIDTPENISAHTDMDDNSLKQNYEDFEEELFDVILNELIEASTEEEGIDDFEKPSDMINEEVLENLLEDIIEEDTADSLINRREAIDLVSDEIISNQKIGFFGKFARTLSFFQ